MRGVNWITFLFDYFPRRVIEKKKKRKKNK